MWVTLSQTSRERNQRMCFKTCTQDFVYSLFVEHCYPKKNVIREITSVSEICPLSTACKSHVVCLKAAVTKVRRCLSTCT